MSTPDPTTLAKGEIIISLAVPTDEQLRDDFGPMIEQMHEHYAGNAEAREWSESSVGFVD